MCAMMMKTAIVVIIMPVEPDQPSLPHILRS